MEHEKRKAPFVFIGADNAAVDGDWSCEVEWQYNGDGTVTVLEMHKWRKTIEHEPAPASPLHPQGDSQQPKDDV